jgi:hypothetical protein
LKPACKEPETKRRSWGLLKRRSCLVPTVRGWLTLILSFVLLANLAVRRLHPFLAVNDSIPGGVLVVEGWASDYAMAQAVAEYGSNHYDKVYVTGIPLERGSPLSEFKTYADLGAAVLIKLGLATNVVQAVPTPDVPQDRTYTSAAALRTWWRGHDLATPSKINVFSVGTHARRSRLLYQKAMGKEVTVGIIAAREKEFDPAHWWRTSPGFRDVTGEALAYLYVRLFFRTPKE